MVMTYFEPLNPCIFGQIINVFCPANITCCAYFQPLILAKLSHSKIGPQIERCKIIRVWYGYDLFEGNCMS